MSTDPDEKVRPIIQAGYDIKYTAEITTHATRVQTLEATSSHPGKEVCVHSFL